MAHGRASILIAGLSLCAPPSPIAPHSRVRSSSGWRVSAQEEQHRQHYVKSINIHAHPRSPISAAYTSASARMLFVSKPKLILGSVFSLGGNVHRKGRMGRLQVRRQGKIRKEYTVQTRKARERCSPRCQRHLWAYACYPETTPPLPQQESKGPCHYLYYQLLLSAVIILLSALLSAIISVKALPLSFLDEATCKT